jgi:hypothetical protein
MDVKRNTKHIIAVGESQKALEGAGDLAQYFCENKMITIIGEYHGNKNIDCKDYTVVKVDEYCFKELTNNSDCVVMLEYNDDEPDPSKLDSVLLKETYVKCKYDFPERVLPVDFRHDIMGGQQQCNLYNTNFSELLSKDLQDETKRTPIVHWINAIINPLIEKQESYFSFITENKYKLDKIQSIFQIEQKNIINDLKSVQKEIERLKRAGKDIEKDRKNLNSIQESLKIIFQMASDLKILSNLFNVDTNVNEYIIIVGMKHFQYIVRIIEYIFNLYDNEGEDIFRSKISSPDIDNCVTLYDSFVWNEIEDLNFDELKI